MIVDNRIPVEIRGVILALMASHINFFLTGSRFFGNYHLDSDWDYFTYDCWETREFLTHLGFKEITDQKYRDLSIKALYEYKKDGQVIHVQLVDSAKDKVQAQAILFNILPLMGNQWKNKESRDVLWNLVLRGLRREE